MWSSENDPVDVVAAMAMGTVRTEQGGRMACGTPRLLLAKAKGCMMSRDTVVVGSPEDRDRRRKRIDHEISAADDLISSSDEFTEGQKAFLRSFVEKIADAIKAPL